MKYPLQNWASVYNPNNPFGAIDKQYYPATWSHIGADYVVVPGTEIYAPYDGKITQTIVSTAKGNTALFVFQKDGKTWGLELCHLNELPSTGAYCEGEVMAHSGNTGAATTGAHLHCVIHQNAQMDSNYAELLTGEHGQAGRDRFLAMVAAGKLVDPNQFFTDTPVPVIPTEAPATPILTPPSDKIAEGPITTPSSTPMNYSLLKSRTVWTVFGMFIVGGLTAVEPIIPGSARTIVEAILGLAAIYFHANPSQQYNSPS